MGWTAESVAAVKRAARIVDVIARDTKVKKDGSRLIACCRAPGHQDDTPSVVIDEGKGVWKCHGCGRGGSAVDWIKEVHGLSFPEAMRQLADITGVLLVMEGHHPATGRRCVATYSYTDAAGVELYRIERWEPGKNGRAKDFVQKLADGTPKRSDVQVPLHLAAVLKAETVYVVEGEKAAQALDKLGVVGTTWAGGAQAAKRCWDEAFCEHFRGRRVVLLPDNDDPGRECMDHVASRLRGVAAAVVVVMLPLEGKGDDVVEWMAAGGTRAKLEDLARAAASNGGWKIGLRYVGRFLVGSVANLELILENDAAVAGLFRLDSCAARVMVQRAPPWAERAAAFPRPLADSDVVRLRIWLERSYGVSFSDVGAVLSSVADRLAYDPLSEWLRSLRWDGVPRLSTWLVRYAGAEDSHYTSAAGRAYAISAVARALSPGCKVDHTLVLEGEQGKGKSTLLRALVGDEWFMDHLPDFTSKDCALALRKGWVHELAELATLNRAEVEKIKQFLTQQDDVYRPPYGTNIVEIPRRCVFAATTNKDDYLRDTTGNRRFWPVRCGELKPELASAEREMFWAEAVAAYDGGEPWHLVDAQIMSLASAEQADRLERDPWTDTLAAHLESPMVEIRRWTEMAECLSVLGVEVAKRAPRDCSRVRACLTALGWVERRPPRAEKSRARRWVPDPTVPGDPTPVPGLWDQPSAHSNAAKQGDPSGPRENGRSITTPTPPAPEQQGIPFSRYVSPPQSNKTHGISGISGISALGSGESDPGLHGTTMGSGSDDLGPPLADTLDDVFGGDR